MSDHRYIKPFRDYLSSHGINEEIAGFLGVVGGTKTVTYNYRDADGKLFDRKRDLRSGKTYQPKGTPLVPWTPAGTEGVLLVCEGESDCLAAISALYEIHNLAEEDEDPDRHLFLRENLPPPVAGLAPIGLPGANSCHQKVADLAESLVADVWIALDADEAGRTNAEKLAKKINAKDHISARILHLPDGMDLADLLAAADDPVEALANLIAEAEASEEVHVEEDDVAAAVVETLAPEAIGALLEHSLTFLDRYVSLPGDAERTALGLFVAHTYAIAGAHATPYMLILSPEKRSGKTRLMETLGLLVSKPWPVIGASEAAVFRKIAKDQPTMLQDEVDAVFGSNAERTEPLRAILNAGNRPGAAVSRCVGENKDIEDFPIFCPKVLAGIDNGRIPDTIRDRSLSIGMRRKTGAEPVERFRHRIADAEVAPLRREFEGWAAGGVVDLLLASDPELPTDLDDRAAEAWEPLLSIADLAGGDWGTRARVAAVALSGGADRDEVTTGALLLGAVRGIFGDLDRITTAELLDALNGNEEIPFGAWRDGKGLDGRLLAKLLKPYRVKPKTIKLFDGTTAKGYTAEAFAEAWERWLTQSDTSVTGVTSVTDEASVTDIPHQQAEVTAVTPVTPKANGVTASAEEEAELERIAAEMGVEI